MPIEIKLNQTLISRRNPNKRVIVKRFFNDNTTEIILVVPPVRDYKTGKMTCANLTQFVKTSYLKYNFILPQEKLNPMSFDELKRA